MNPKPAAVLLVLLLLGLSAVEVLAQDVGADVRTWSGHSLRLSQVSLEIRYTIVPPKGGAGAYGGGAGAAGGASAGAYAGPLITGMGGSAGGGAGIGSLQAFQQFTSQSAEPIHGRRPVDYLNVYQGGVTHRLAVARIASIAFKRQPVLTSTLPPYVAPEHVVSSALVTFTDGSTLDGDYVNAGTMLLRGTTPEGRVEIPWEEIETVRFSR